MLTREQFLEIYNNSIRERNSNIAVGIPGTDIYFKGNAVSQIASNISADIDELYDNIFSPSASGAYLDKHGLNVGLTPRRGALPANGTAILPYTGKAEKDFIIPSGLAMKSSITNLRYYVMYDVFVSAGEDIDKIAFEFASEEIGEGNISYGNLDFESTIIVGELKIEKCKVKNISSGSNIETDSEYAVRIFNYRHFPRGSGSLGDYTKWAYQSTPLITEALTFRYKHFPPAINFPMLFPTIMGGSSNPNFYIDGNEQNNYTEAAYPIDRSLPKTIISTSQKYMESVKGINDNPNVLTVNTYKIEKISIGNLNVYASLSPSITLDTIIDFPIQKGGPIKVRDFIKREIRRSIISVPPFGIYTNIDGISSNYYIPCGYIENSVMSAIKNNVTLQGIYASLVTSMHINFEDMRTHTISYNIPVPNEKDRNIIEGDERHGYFVRIIYDIKTDDDTIKIYAKAQP